MLPRIVIYILDEIEGSQQLKPQEVFEHPYRSTTGNELRRRLTPRSWPRICRADEVFCARTSLREDTRRQQRIPKLKFLGKFDSEFTESLELVCNSRMGNW